MSNLKQLGTAMQMWAQDHEETLPPVVNVDPSEVPTIARGFTVQATWVGQLQPYTKNWGIFVCPSSGKGLTAEDPNTVVFAANDWRRYPNVLQNYGYLPNSAVLGSANQTANTFWGSAAFDGVGGFVGSKPFGPYMHPTRIALAAIAQPADVVVITDHVLFDWGFLSSGGRDRFGYPDPRHIKIRDIAANVPDGRINCVFADGHAKSLSHADFWSRQTTPGGEVFKHLWPRGW